MREKLEGMSEEELWEMLADLYLDLDFERYSKEILKVQRRSGGAVVPFILNQPQRILHQIFDDIKANGRLIRVFILKGRRMGISTYVSGRFYKKTSNTKNYYSLQVSHEPQASGFLFDMIKRFYNLSPEKGRPELLFNNQRLLSFNNAKGTGLDSAFRVATAGKDNIGSGQNINLLHGSEVAFWQEGNAESIFNSVLPCVPSGDPESEVIMESTANGVGGEFYTRFWGARFRYWISRLDDQGLPVVEMTINPDADKTNEYASIFFPWFMFEDNTRPIPEHEKFELTDDELKIKAMFNVSDEQMYWRRFTIANEFKGDLLRFAEAHPSTPEEAFISTGTPYFDNVKVMAAKKAAPPPINRYEYNVATGQWQADKEGRLFVWEEPKAGKSYVIGADVSEGLVEGDFNNADVVDHRTGEQTAQWHGKCALNEWGDILMAIGKRYNKAYLGIERNNAGVAVVNRVFDAGYPRQHMELREEPPNKPVRRFGWHTNEKTRPMILDNLKTEMAHGTHGIKSAETFGEMLVFQRTKTGRYEAQPGCFDDRVLSLAIAKFLRNEVPIPAAPPPSHHKVGQNSGGVSNGGWGGVGLEGRG